MLKSHFNLQKEAADETQVEEEAEKDAEILTQVQSPPPPPPPVVRLKSSQISVRLSVLGKTAEGDGYTYLKATCTNMGLNDITALIYFKHLQFVDVSNNQLTSDNLQVLADLPFLLLIQADKNLINSAALKKMKYLQIIIMNNNNITSVNDVFQPELSTLEIGYNKIQKVFFDNKMPQLKCLDLRYNLLHDIMNLEFPNLDSLYLAGNKIKSLIGIERLVNLRVLHLRNNPIKNLNGFNADNKKLQYVNLRNCKIATLKQVKKLKVLPMIETLILKGCPYFGGAGQETADAGQDEEEDTETRVEVIAALPRLKRLNKTDITTEERTEAKELMMQLIDESDKDEEIEGEEEIIEEQVE